MIRAEMESRLYDWTDGNGICSRTKEIVPDVRHGYQLLFTPTIDWFMPMKISGMSFTTVMNRAVRSDTPACNRIVKYMSSTSV